MKQIINIAIQQGTTGTTIYILFDDETEIKTILSYNEECLEINNWEDNKKFKLYRNNDAGVTIV